MEFPKSWTLAIFKIFSHRFLHKWDSAIENRELEIVEEWTKRLANLTSKQIKRGLRDWNEDWPPNVEEFKKTCLGTRKNGLGLNFRPAYHQFYKIEKLIESDEHKLRKRQQARFWVEKTKKDNNL